MKLRANVDTFNVTYNAELSEIELRLIARALNSGFWNFVATPEELTCREIVDKIITMLPVKEPKREFGAVGEWQDDD